VKPRSHMRQRLFVFSGAYPTMWLTLLYAGCVGPTGLTTIEERCEGEEAARCSVGGERRPCPNPCVVTWICDALPSAASARPRLWWSGGSPRLDGLALRWLFGLEASVTPAPDAAAAVVIARMGQLTSAPPFVAPVAPAATDCAPPSQPSAAAGAPGRCLCLSKG
jgi:hypothetical protein